MQQLFHNKMAKAYYLVCSQENLDVHCSHCNDIIQIHQYLFIHNSYSKKEFIKEFLCSKCIGKQKTRLYDEFVVAEIIDFTPDNSIIVPDFPPTLQPTKPNISSVSEIQKDISKGIEIDNQCKFAFNPERNKQIGFEEDKELFERRMEELDVPFKNKFDGLYYIDNIQESKPLIEEHKKNRIEAK